ncbi:hypothetical protein KKD70_03655 [Patescibacteria group bacterium]|nr:hypothetical protein [Patescibacteria group bacterium]
MSQHKHNEILLLTDEDQREFDRYSKDIKNYPMETLEKLIKSNDNGDPIPKMLIEAARNRIAKLKITRPTN